MEAIQVFKKYPYLILTAALLISFFMHFPHFTKELMSVHVWRQTQTQSTIDNFYEEDMNILQPRKNERGSGEGVFRMEFPLMQWLVALVYKVFGNHIIITRISMFIIGSLSVIGMYKLLFNLFKHEALAVMGAWAFSFSPCIYYYFINPIPDNLGLCLAIWGMSFFFKWHGQRKIGSLWLSSMMLGLGALCKLPFILYFVVPFSYLFSELVKSRSWKFGKTILVFFLGAILPLLWYLWVIAGWAGNSIVMGVLDNKRGNWIILEFLWGHFISMLPELLLNYAAVPFFLAGFYFIYKNKAYKHCWFSFMLIWAILLLAYLLYEITAIGIDHDYYLFPFYPLLFILVGYGAFNLLKMAKQWTFISLFLLCFLPVTAYIRMHGRWDAESPGFNKDLLKFKEELRMAVPNDALCIAGNDKSHFVFFYYIDKKGWGFDNDSLSKSMEAMISDGAKYLYSDSRPLENSSRVSPFLEKLILERGSIRIYKLKSR